MIIAVNGPAHDQLTQMKQSAMPTKKRTKLTTLQISPLIHHLRDGHGCRRHGMGGVSPVGAGAHGL